MRCRQCHITLFDPAETRCRVCGGRAYPAQPEGADPHRLETMLQSWWVRLAAGGSEPALASDAAELYALHAMLAPASPGSDPGEALTALDPVEALSLVYRAVQCGRVGDAARWLTAVAGREHLEPAAPEARCIRWHGQAEFSLSCDSSGLHLAARSLPLGDPYHVLTVAPDGDPQAPSTLPPLVPADWAVWSRQLQAEAAAAFLIWKAVAAPAALSEKAADAFVRQEWQQLQQRLDAVRDRMPIPPAVAELRQQAAERHRGFFRALQPEAWLEALEAAALRDLGDTASALRREWEAAVEADLAGWVEEQMATTGRSAAEGLGEAAQEAVGSIRAQLARLLRTGECLLERTRASLNEGLADAARSASSLAWVLGRRGRLDEPGEQAALFVERLREVHLLLVIESCMGWLADAIRRSLQDAEAAAARREAEAIALRQGTERALKEAARWDSTATKSCLSALRQLETSWFDRHRREIWKIASPLSSGGHDDSPMLKEMVALLEPIWPGGDARREVEALCAAGA